MSQKALVNYKAVAFKLLTALLCLFCQIQAQANAAPTLTTAIEKHPDGRWTVSYQSSAPISAISLAITPDDTRLARWTPESANFAISHLNGDDTIRRHDGAKFTEVVLNLTPTYVVLIKQYAPFSPYSDGGMLVHSGRFFACPEQCTDDNTSWPMQVIAPESDNIFAHSQLHTGSVSWIDQSPGVNTYVGQGVPIETDEFIAIIDSGLPDSLTSQLDKFLPALNDYYNERLGALTTKPMLFASYGKTAKGRRGNQGGTLPNQMFMHWYGDDLQGIINEPQVLHFFSHEVAHLYQDNTAKSSDQRLAWVHEGSADLMASTSFAEFGLTVDPQSSKHPAVAQQQCLAGLEGHSLLDSGTRGRFDLYYSCGLTLYLAILKDALKQDQKVDIFTLWDNYRTQVKQSQSASIATFLQSVSQFVSPEFLDTLSAMIDADDPKSATHLMKLMQLAESSPVK